MTTAAPVPAAPPGCPFNAEFLPPNMRKHVDPAAPVPLRMMAAKGLVPLNPSDMLGVLYMLTYDTEQGVRDTAPKTAAGLPDRILGSALRDEGVQAPVLGWFLGLLRGKDVYAEMLVLNASTPDEAVADVARDCSAKLAEIIGQNQLRILRHENIIRNLCANGQVGPALIDSVCDFAVRSGLTLTDVPQMQAARVRLFGPQAVAAPPDPGPTAEQVLQEFQEEGGPEETAAPMEEGKRLNLTQRIMKMSIAEKIKLATLGNKEARSALIRDSNKLVCTAVIRSPRITDGEVLLSAGNKAANEEVLRIIYGNREWTKNLKIKLALVKNPKVPLTVVMKFLNSLRDSELKDLSKDRNVPSGVQSFAKKVLEKKTAPKKEGG
ncbi:hypothetical protein POL68_05420 [Stigmatella sp. ncwal1]|uniref:Uncharacterized protein n=1 Tax=Stigmatella ashevillensis TaxID=2995309 RepID=A0ABT5D2L4_9BACT|nr:hypothetical protein [Stigmatella ashevillena]MDC0707903.1 hypothetical protein [Stigmatella ashevillena]